LPEAAFEQMFGAGRDPQTIADDRFQHARMMRPTAHWHPDLTALRAAATRIVVGIGEESGGQICERTSTALATALDIESTMFPGDHVGFFGDPDRFVTRLRAILREN
jgi:hypothetical protein